MIDEALLASVDEQARVLGQTRRVFVERALEAALGLRPSDVPSAPPAPAARRGSPSPSLERFK